MKRAFGRGSGLVWLALLLAACIVWLGVLQWRWVREASEAEQARMRALVDARVTQFAHEFDRLVTNVYAQFIQVPGEAQSPSLAERAAEWLDHENTPPIVSAIYAVRGRPGVPLRLERFDEDVRSFVEAAWPGALTGLHERLTRNQPAPGARPAIWRVGPRIDPAAPAVVVARPLLLLLTPASPGAEADPDRDVIMVVALLDEQVIEAQVLPELVGRFFSEEPGFSYRVLVRDEQGTPVFRWPAGADPAAFAEPDASAHILRVRNEFFDRLQRDRSRAMGGPGPGDADARGDGDRRNHEAGGHPADGPPGVRMFMAPRFARGQAVVLIPDFGSPGSRWQVAVVHREGSLARAVARSRRWNLGVSLGVLALLSASVALALVASQRAQRLARERVEFVAGVSHELRTPLAVIRSAAENLADGVVDEPAQVQRYGALIADEGRKLSGMVDQVLQFAGLEAWHSPRLVPLSPAAVLDDALAASAPVLAECGAGVERRLAPALPPVLADHDSLVRALTNLVSNAAKHGAEGGAITVAVTADPPGDRVRFAVTDRGPGIPPHEQKRVFEPFFRGASALTAQVHGSGLGLSLVRRIAEQHGGSVELTSRVGHGSTFALVLPVARGTPDATPAPATPAGDAVPADRPGGA